MAMNVKFIQGTLAKFTALATKDANTFYYITDTKALYLGANLIGDGVSKETFNALAGRVQTLEDWREILKAGATATSKVEGAAIPNLVDVTVSTEDGAVSGVVIDDSALRNFVTGNYVSNVSFNTYKQTQEGVDKAQSDKIAALEETVDGIVSVGGEANLVNDVQINGTTIVADKVANVAVDGAYSSTNKIATMSTVLAGVDAAKTYTNEEITGLEFALSEDGKTLELKNKAGTAVATLDTTDFVVDGMLTSVVADQANNKLTFTWNTDSGVQETVVELSSIADIYKGSTNADEINVVVSNTNEISATIGANVKTKIDNGNTAYSWGNHADAGYAKAADLGDLAAKDTVGTADIDNGAIMLDHIGSGVRTLLENGNTAHGWGNHANAGYAKAADLGDLAGKNEADLDLSSKQDKLSEAQLAAVNSGITATKVGEYDTVKSTVDTNKATWDKAGTAVQEVGTKAVDGGAAFTVDGNESVWLQSTDASKLSVGYMAASGPIPAQIIFNTNGLEAAGAAAAVQGDTTNTVKDCVDAINTMNGQVGTTIGTVENIVAQLTWEVL